MKADLHIHTSFSYDAVSSPQEIVDFAIKKGIDCICITDHGEVKGAIEAMKYGFDKNILVVPGIEIFTNVGDVIGINVKEKVHSGLSAEEAIKEIRKQGGIAIIPHPFRSLFMGFLGSEEKLKNLRPDAIEGFNASDIFMSTNIKAHNFFVRNNFSFTAGSDAHKKDFVGRGYIKFSQNIKSEKDLVDMIMDKKGEIEGHNLNFWELLKNGSSNYIKRIVDLFNPR